MQPRRGKVKPAPFQRDGINIENHGKAWQHIYATDLSVGDIVAEFGKIVEVDDGLYHTILTNINGDQLYVKEDKTVFAFTEKHG